MSNSSSFQQGQQPSMQYQQQLTAAGASSGGPVFPSSNAQLDLMMLQQMLSSPRAEEPSMQAPNNQSGWAQGSVQMPAPPPRQPLTSMLSPAAVEYSSNGGLQSNEQVNLYATSNNPSSLQSASDPSAMANQFQDLASFLQR
ncbi:unnamed protein product [Heterosigma akashiwo]